MSSELENSNKWSIYLRVRVKMLWTQKFVCFFPPSNFHGFPALVHFFWQSLEVQAHEQNQLSTIVKDKISCSSGLMKLLEPLHCEQKISHSQNNSPRSGNTQPGEAVWNKINFRSNDFKPAKQARAPTESLLLGWSPQAFGLKIRASMSPNLSAIYGTNEHLESMDINRKIITVKQLITANKIA